MGWCSASLTQRMLDRLVISTSTSSRAGVKRFWILQIPQRMRMKSGGRSFQHSCKMDPSQLCFSGKQRGRYHILTVRTHAVRLSKSSILRAIKQLDDLLHRAEIVCWVSENLQPFSVVEDRGFQSLMKTGCPGGCYFPSCWTVARDVHLVFARTHNQIAKMLQVGWATVQWYRLLTYLPAIWRENELHHWCVDISHPPGFHCILRPLGARW